MGLAQTKLHHRVLQGNWSSILRRLQTPEGKHWAMKGNPCGDLPLHLACYGGQTPPAVVRALIVAYPGGVHHKNDMGFTPIQLARVNYRRDHPFREEVLEFLEVYSRIDNNNSYSSNNSDAVRVDSNPASEQEDRNSNNDDDNPQLIAAGKVAAKLLQPHNTYQTSRICVICLENEADHVVISCGHQCLCGSCAKKVLAGGKYDSNNSSNNNKNTSSTQRYCPVGRCKIGAIVKVSVSSE
mmetsp:Transcript_22955/g.50014  ORF Transcript_22955/g.50014 Transcript_22955/m.50014 type:complete len:240 (+) Transcript_22955:729-1448(+)